MFRYIISIVKGNDRRDWKREVGIEPTKTVPETYWTPLSADFDLLFTAERQPRLTLGYSRYGASKAGICTLHGKHFSIGSRYVPRDFIPAD